jgi:hypothetical protein
LIASLFRSVCTPGVQVLNGGQPLRKEDVWSGVSADLSVPVHGRYWQARPVELLMGVLTGSWLSA